MLSDWNYNQFLLELDKQKHKTLYARIIALDLNESPIETIEGRVTQGSINIDGASAVRRTCSLTIVAQNFDYNNYLWGMNTKFKLEIGVVNTIDPSYPDIIWFKQGIYLITNFNVSSSTNNFTISLQGKDKMCQLNGEVSGTLTQSVDFGKIEEEVAGGSAFIIRHLPIKDIIRNAVHQFGGEPFHNIIINDLEELGLELMEYRYDTPMFLYKLYPQKGQIESNVFQNVLIGGEVSNCYIDDEDRPSMKKPVPNLNDLGAKYFMKLVDDMTGVDEKDCLPIYFFNNEEYIAYKFAKVEIGQTVGYRITDLTYPGDLLANAGDSITSVLDKIKNVLGEFEYFYDLDGKFTFQRKKSFVNTLYSPIVNNKEQEQYVESLVNASSTAYIFSEGELISQFNNNPNLLNLRNDFAVWGERTTSAGATKPIHIRYAIDKKPIRYKKIIVSEDNPSDKKQIEAYNKKNNVNVKYQKEELIFEKDTCDWREIIYQMAKDYYQYNFLDDFEVKIIEANPQFITGKTGYEQYYTDLLSFWRELYDDDNKDDELYYQEGPHKGWNKNVYEHPELLDFWFDFLDIEGELDQFNVKAVGSRPKVYNDNKIKSIYFRETPNIIFVADITKERQKIGYKYIQYSNIDGTNSTINWLFSVSSQGVSAKDKLDELIYNHSYCCESATITTTPIYHLEPNTRIYLYDEKTNLHNDYIIDKMTIPLTYNGMMTINATKAAETLL